MADEFSQEFTPVRQNDQPKWLNEYFRLIKVMLDRVRGRFVFDELHVEPAKKENLLTVFADGTDWDPGSGRGLYFWDSAAGPAAWVKV